MRTLVGFLFNPPPTYRVHVPTKTSADILRAMNFSIWTSLMRHGKARADVIAEHGADGWRRVQRCFRAAFAGKGPSIGLIGEASYLAGIEFKFDIADPHPFVQARTDSETGSVGIAKGDEPKNPHTEKETG